MKRTRTVHLLTGGDVDVPIDPRDIVWPQSVCPLCTHVGSGVAPHRWCRCETDYVTVSSLAEYQVLAKNASPPRPLKLARDEASLPGWSKRRSQ